jgi:prevent-host-death family protein
MRKMKVSVAEAKNRFAELIKAAENAKTIIVTRRGKPVADIVRTSEPAADKPKFGTLKDRIVIHDPDWWKPMTDKEVESFLEAGRY